MITEKNCFWKRLMFFKFGPGANVSWKICVNHRQLREIAIQVSTETFWRNYVLFLTDTKFFRLRTLTDAILNIQRKLFCQFCQYGIQRIQRNDWMKFLSYKELELFYQFWTLNEKSLDFLPENFVTVVKIVLACPGYVFLQLFFVKNVQFLFVLFVFWLI